MSKKFKSKKFSNLIAIIICVALAVSALTASLGFLSKGFTNTDVGSWFIRDVNEDNLIKEAAYYDNLPEELDNGLRVRWKDSGEIVLSGKVDDGTVTNDTIPTPITFATVNLEAGKTYTLSTGNKSCDKKTFGLVAEYIDNEGNKIKEFIGSEAYIIDLSEYSSSVDLTLSVFYENDVIYIPFVSYVRPTLVEGTSTGEFYA